MVETAKLKHDKTMDEKMLTKLKRQWHQDILDMNNYKNMYLLSLHAANDCKIKYHEADIPDFLKSMSELTESVSTG